MEILIYFKTLSLLTVLSVCGYIIFRRICEAVRIQIILPAAVIIGITLYIFLLNLVAYAVKGPPGFYIALAIEILLTYFLKRKIKPKEIIFPQGKEKVFWIISLSLWSTLLLYISATGHASSGDFLNHTTLASLFVRGDFPIHAPFQPERLSSYHVGGLELLGAFKSITGAPYTLLFAVFSFVTLLSISQIFQWILRVPAAVFNWVLLLLIPVVALISFGNFMIVWPYQLGFPDIQEGVFNWFSKLPSLKDSFDVYGSPTSLDSLNLFFHRMLSLSIFAVILPLALFPNKAKRLLLKGVLIILLATIALTDETVFIVGVPAIVFILLFTLFEKNIKQWFLFCFILVALTVLQGGLVYEVFFQSDSTIAKVLLFPDDGKGPLARFHNYRSFRLEQQASRLLPEEQEYYPLRWFHPGIIWQLGVLFFASCLFTVISKKNLADKSPIFLIWLFCISAITSFIAYHLIVPEGWTHLNGNRFLALSYQLSGVAIAILIILGWIHLKARNKHIKILAVTLKFLLIWLLVTSIIPPFASLFPRQKYNWFAMPNFPKKEELKWVENNLKVSNKILAFMEKHPTGGGILELVRDVGVFTPAWYDKPETQGFDVSPPYLDLFFTLNPEILEILKVEYIMTNKLYRSTLFAERLADLENSEYLQVVYSDEAGDIIISKILPSFLLKAENYKGTFYELSKQLPSKGAFFIESPPLIDETAWRVVFLTLQMQDYELYYSTKFLPIYNFVINVDLKFSGESNDKYDYLVLEPNTDPRSIVKSQTTLFWSDIADHVKIWKVE